MHTDVYTAPTAPTCTSTGLTYGISCSDCEKVIVAQTEVDVLEHGYDWVYSVTTEPTYTAEGAIFAEYKCTNCNDVGESKSHALPAISENDYPLTEGNGPNQGGGIEEPSQPTEPAYIKFNGNYVVADYNGGKRSVMVDAAVGYKWDIISSGEEWFSAERADNTLVVTFSESTDKLERRGTIRVAVGSGENFATASINVLQIGTDTEELIYEVETTEPNQRVIAAPILTYQNGFFIILECIRYSDIAE